MLFETRVRCVCGVVWGGGRLSHFRARLSLLFSLAEFRFPSVWETTCAIFGCWKVQESQVIWGQQDMHRAGRKRYSRWQERRPRRKQTGGGGHPRF
jgi:hypothetical protein